MSVVRSLWDSVQGDPRVFMRRVNVWLTILWILTIPLSIATRWINSVTYVAALSLWALVSGHWSAWQAARVEVAQAKEKGESQRTWPQTWWIGSSRRLRWKPTAFER